MSYRDHDNRRIVVDTIDDPVGKIVDEASSVRSLDAGERFRIFADCIQGLADAPKEPITKPWTSIVIPTRGADQLLAGRSEKPRGHFRRRFAR